MVNLIQEEWKWDIRAINNAIEEVEVKKFISRGIALKGKKNKSRSYLTELVYDYQIDKIEFFMRIRDKNNMIIKL